LFITAVLPDPPFLARRTGPFVLVRSAACLDPPPLS